MVDTERIAIRTKLQTSPSAERELSIPYTQKENYYHCNTNKSVYEQCARRSKGQCHVEVRLISP